MNGPTRALEAVTTRLPVKTGDFVSWPASRGAARGRIVSVHTNSKVPGVLTELVGNELAPAARVRLYAKSGDGWAPTDVYVPHVATALTVVDTLPEPTVAASEAVVGSFDDIREKVRDAIKDRIEALTGRENGCYVYVYDLGVDWAVYDVSDDLWQVPYSLDGEAVVLGEPFEVFKQTTYVPADNAPDSPTVPATESADRIHGRLLAAKGTDDAGGRVYGVQIIAYGDSLNSRRYSPDVMRAAASLYEGAKAYDHHRSDDELRSSTVQGLVGSYRNVVATDVGLEADLHLLPSATHVAETLDASLANQTAGLAPLVGISHDVMATYKPVVADGKKLMEATSIVKVNSADVVADPAAGGQATRMVAGGIGTDPPETKEPSTVNLKQLLELLRAAESAKRPALLQEHASILTAAGITADDATRMAEALPAPEPVLAGVGGRSTEATIARTSTMAHLLASTAVKAAKLDERLVESILGELGDQFTEGELTAKVEAFKRIGEGFEKIGLKPTVHALEGVTGEEHDKKIERLDSTFAGDFAKGYRSLKEAFLDITGATPRWSDTEELNRRILRESITLMEDGHRREYDSGLRGTESVDSTTWGSILGDSITRRMVAEYAQPSLQTWRPIVSSIVPVNDFRSQKLERMGGYGVLPAVLQGAPYQALTSPGNDTEPTYTISKRGGTEDLTLETIANDDLRAVIRIPVKLGLAAAQTLYRFVFDFLNSNAAIYDSVALFHATHANTTSTALSGSALSVSRRKLRTQAAYGDSSDILSLTPKYLLVPSSLEELAWQLCTSALAMPSGAPVGAASDIPNIHQGMQPIVVDYWESTSSTEWFVVADPALAPTIELGFYQGQQDPALFVQNDPTVGSAFTADKVTWKIRHIYSGAVIDYRGFQRGNS